MSIRELIKRKIMSHMVGLERRDRLRVKAERQRQRRKAPHIVEYFHEAGDPYSNLMVQLLPVFCERYEIELMVHLVSPPSDQAAPDRSRLVAYGRQDAARLATKIGLSFEDAGSQPSLLKKAAAIDALKKAINSAEFLQRAPEIERELWTIDDSGAAVEPPEISRFVLAGDARRETLGHYLGGTLYYAGEWYWGPDRLHYLEARLSDLGAKRDKQEDRLIFPPPASPSAIVSKGAGMSDVSKGEAQQTARPELHWYLSFRSPYTGIVAPRVKALADAYNVELKIRFVLPMVMRGLSVPASKGLYITKDVAREADRLGVPFGNISDPVGAPVERGYAVLYAAIAQGRGYEFAKSFLEGVWAEGINAGTDKGLRRLTERAGLDWSEMRRVIGTDDWRAVEALNQQELLDYGLWGVPSFRVDETAAWGQDRLWVIEDRLRQIRN